MCLIVPGILSLAGGCGFSDTLTARGFVKGGDDVCLDTLVSAGAEFQNQENLTGSEFLAQLATAYRAAAVGFRQLDVREEDRAMRDTAVNEYSSAASRLRAASTDPTGSEAPTSQVFTDQLALERRLKAYGFDVCGGGGGELPRQ